MSGNKYNPLRAVMAMRDLNRSCRLFGITGVPFVWLDQMRTKTFELHLNDRVACDKMTALCDKCMDPCFKRNLGEDKRALQRAYKRLSRRSRKGIASGKEQASEAEREATETSGDPGTPGSDQGEEGKEIESRMLQVDRQGLRHR